MKGRIARAAARQPASHVLHVSRWFNTTEPIPLDSLRGQVVVVYAFQMLCPGCVMHGLPQVVRLREAFPKDQLAVIGLHTVFEHHDVMGTDALQAFIHEYRLRFPIGVDEADPRSPIPKTMAAWGLQGTPSLALLDREGQVQFSHLGRIDDLALGALVGQLLERPLARPAQPAREGDQVGCSGAACALADQRPISKEKS